MNLIVVVLGSAVLLALAYLTYGTYLTRMLRLDPEARTPAVEMRDDVDYAPIEPKFLIGQHFSAIAAAGPIVGPILAGMMFGWVPALLWILLGGIFVGGVHDFTTLVASIRHKARSITELVKEHMSRRAFFIFLAFIWLTLVYIIVAFTDITANSFVGEVKLESGATVKGGAIASSSLMYLTLPVIMGLLMRRAKLSLGWATAIFLPLVGVSVWAGKFIPLSLDDLILGWGLASDAASAQRAAVKAWDAALLLYCFAAALSPMWLLLQPRGHLGGYFLYAAIVGGGVGLLLDGSPIRYPAFISPASAPLFPNLFIIIACGACSGFHAIVASGTTSRQLRRETDAKAVGYGSMLLESLVAVLALSCVMMLAKDNAILSKPPNFIYANGMARFLSPFGIPPAFAIAFGLLAFTTFVYDTLDVCTRLGRYIIEELTGWSAGWGRWLSNFFTAGAPLLFVMRTTLDAKGAPIPVWKYFWPLFGASNQLLASLALLGVTVWLARSLRARWVWIVTGVPTAFMYVTSVWSLMKFLTASFMKDNAFFLSPDPVAWVALVLVVLAALMLVEAVKALANRPSFPSGLKPASAAAG